MLRHHVAVERASVFDFKFKAEMFYRTKGHLNATRETIEGMFDSYFKRAWGNHEWVTHGEGFEEAWKKYQAHIMVK